MNARSFKVIFSKRLGALVAVGENATAQGKSASGEATHSASGLSSAASSADQHVGVLKHICLAALMGSATQAFALDANALPTGAELRHGAATVGTEGATMTINQSSSRATINWQSFNVGEKARVNVVQNDSQSVLLNRVVGNDMSQIRGQISANGQVVLVNPNGIVMGPTGRITASAFTASTFGITDANFQNGNMAFERNGSDGKVVHQGHIQTAEAGGYVALIGAEVSNEGTIQTRQGAVVLAAAERVSLPSVSDMNSVSVPLSHNVRLEIDPAAFGSASVTNSGVIQTEGGQVLLRAAAVVDAVSKVAAARVTHTGSIDTTGEQGGRVDILADKGIVRVSGKVKANSTDGTAGGTVMIGRRDVTKTVDGKEVTQTILAAVSDVSGAQLESRGGFVETSGDWLGTNSVTVLAKEWLLDPTDITISNATQGNVIVTTPGNIIEPLGGAGTSSVVNVGTIQNAINGGTSVTIKTTRTGNTGTDAGNITIANNLAFANNSNNNATLSLIADNGITQNANIITSAVTGKTGLVHINMEAKGNFQGNTAANAESKGITLNGSISTNGSITLTGTSNPPVGGSGVGVNSTGTLTAGGDVLVTGTAKGASTGANVHNVTSTGGKVTVIGTSATGKGATTSLGSISAAGDVTITGTSSGAATGAETGNITSTNGSVKVEGKSESGAAVKVANITTGTANDTSTDKNITIIGNSTSGAILSGSGVIKAAGKVSITGAGHTTGTYAITTGNTIDATSDVEIKTTSKALHGIAIRGNVTSSGGKVDIYADVSESGDGSAMNGNFAIKAKNDVTITGKSNGYYTINGLGAIESTEGKVTIDATSTNSSALRLTNAVKAKGDVLIKGAGGNDSGINTGATTTVTSTDGNIEFIGTTTGSGVGVNFTGTTNINATNGTFKVTAESKSSQGVVFQGNTNVNAATYTIDAKSLGGAAGLYHGSGNTTLTSTAGDSSIKGTSENGRGVFGFNGNINLNANNGSTTTFSSGKGEMRLGWGGGVTVNTNGNVTLGSDQSNFFSQADTTVNSGTLTIKGKSAGHGVAIQDGSGYSTDILVKNGSSLVIVGESTGSGSGIHLLPVGVANKIEMTGQNAGGQKGSITMTGVSAAGVGISTGSTPITSDGGEISLKGTGNGANGTGMNLNGLVQSVNGATGGKITIDANTLSLTGGPALLDAGSNGTVNIKTHNNNDILVGAADVRSATPANQKLGIDQAELSLIKAGNLVIGDTASTGNITVSGPATTAAATGDITLKTGGSIAVNAALTVGDAAGTKNLTLDAGGAITNGASGKLTAKDLTLKAGSTIGADGAAIKTNVATANLTSAGHQFLVEDTEAVVAAKTTGNGNINITTNNGTMTVGSVNGVSGIDAGTGNVGLTANSGSGHGIHMSSDVKGKDITVDTTANNGTGLGFYGAGGSFTASGTLNLTGTATGTGNGFYSYGGTHSAQTGINITGTSANGQGVGFDRNVVLTNASNDIVITGTSNGTGTNPEAIGLRGSSITNTNGNIKLVAAKGNVFTNSEGGTPGQYWGLTGPLTNTITNNGTGEIQILAGSTKLDNGTIDGKVLTINQKGNGGVLVKTTGNGNVIAPKITNAGTGNVVMAAGSLKDDGDGSGGQVLTSISSPVTQTNSGKTFIYSGNAADTGVLSNIDSTLGDLKVDGTAAQNADTNAAFGAGTGISGSNAKAQVIFREKLTVAPGALADATLEKTYGDESTKNTSGAALLAEAKGALKNAAANSGTNSTFATGPEGTKNRIVVSKSVVVDSLTGPSALTNGTNSLATSDFSSSEFLKAKDDTYQFKGFTSTKYDGVNVDVEVNVAKLKISLSGINAVDKAFDGSTAAELTGQPSLVIPVQLAGDEVDQPNVIATFNDPLVGSKVVTVTALQLTGHDADNYEVIPATLPANITGAVEPIDPPTPVVPVTPAANTNVVVTVAAANNNFQLAGAEGQCSADTLVQCECETATDTAGAAIEGIQLCYEPMDRSNKTHLLPNSSSL